MFSIKKKPVAKPNFAKLVQPSMDLKPVVKVQPLQKKLQAVKWFGEKAKSK